MTQQAYSYRRIFDPPANVPVARSLADRSDAPAYVYSEAVVLAVNVALAAGRPLLVRGPSGVGKSSLARSVASVLGRSLYEIVVTGRTEAQDFLWKTDHVQRLRDAQIGADVADMSRYVLPGPLFWAFDPDKAQSVLTAAGRAQLVPAGHVPAAKGALVLIDEIDKAEPDVPNGLLEPLGMLSFHLDDLGERISAPAAPLILITTNEERELPQAFLRRCIEIDIPPPDAEWLVRVGSAHFPHEARGRLEDIANRLIDRAQTADLAISTAEFLDTVRACRTLDIGPDSPAFAALVAATAAKTDRVSRNGA